MLEAAELIDLQTKVDELIEERNFSQIRQILETVAPPDIAEIIEELGKEHEAVLFRLLPQTKAVEVFEHLPLENQESLMFALADKDAAAILDDMSPDDRTAFLEELPGKVTRRLMNLLSADERHIATQLLGYPEDSIGRLMTPDYVAIKTSWTVAQALGHIRIYGHDSETLNVLYVVEKGGKLIDDIRVREILLASPDALVSDLMDHQFAALTVTDDQEAAVAAFLRHDRSVLPVTDSSGILLGIVTADDILDVAEEEATEDIQKLGGVEALEEPYMTISLFKLIRKRSFWLIFLFFGQMLTATAMGFFQEELEKALVLALFVPLIISSGGNTGSQAATLIIRALTIGEIGLGDWWRVMRREIFSGLIIGTVLGSLGFLRILIGESLTGVYGQPWPFIALTIAFSLMGVVMWGTLSGSLLPFVLKRLGLDPATSSAPLVATLVDVTGLLIYFSVAAFVLKGSLL
ncbi:MAG: magnesium transporter [Trueperaceae bacterium]|nr:magnesium transporter [Trueperaceae bacterium]